MESFDHTTDVLVIGSGAGALTAAARSRSLGMDTILAEKTDKIGGTSAYSGGAIWVPQNHIQPQYGIHDLREDAARYVDAIVKEDCPATSPARRAFLEDEGFQWNLDHPYPDYHALEPGASTSSRSLSPVPFDLRRLTWQPVMDSVESRSLVNIAVFRTLWNLVRGAKPVVMGLGLVARLLDINLRLGTNVWINSGLAGLIQNTAGDVVGAVVQRGAETIRVRAKRGVILVAGGFARNDPMFSSTAPGDKGDAIVAAMDIGADVALMKHAWWMPSLMDNGKPIMDVYARSLPHSIIVDQSGKRFFNESECYCDAGANILARNDKVASVHSWLIIDRQHRNKYMLGRLLPRLTPKSAITSGFVFRSKTLGGLARQIGVDEGQLAKTVARFNEFAETGIDEDFHRGDNPYNGVFSDPSHKPNANLGSIAKAPFYAVKVFPGDIGTKGGLVTDENARVMTKEGKPIKGLYAAGNTSASVFGSRYPGAGGTIGPAMTFAFVAAEVIARTQV
ncbi:FAD binding domain-containing protein [Plectosphaerella cucumerina]|uniref:FAD binding domain-containing protein n=1 Tax=Plectosphaerella cucumerina TaxID=40658 RepID=A0A8K0TSL1_9PEZI|nr:FAD binding domain-containing protein [Plectosphaerella cucumerina]